MRGMDANATVHACTCIWVCTNQQVGANGPLDSWRERRHPNDPAATWEDCQQMRREMRMTWKVSWSCMTLEASRIIYLAQQGQAGLDAHLTHAQNRG